ncbi:hypothetical protein BKA56DRAFT_736009 [Ilyonectria sp. MPI-CAGE-AT-0026]|nr:hypothetical protein BKA56DRAFT_736009 [Ilyonectria sp. MPI-CAGE-AT-0026]
MAFQDNLDLGSSSLHASCESSSTLSLQCHLGTPNTTNHAKSQNHDDDHPLDLTTDEDTLDSKNDDCSIGSHATTDARSDRSSTSEEHPPFSTDDEDLTSSHPNPGWHTGSPQPLEDDSSILTSDEFASTTVVILGREFLYYQNAGRFVSWDPIDAHYHTCLQLNRKIFQLSTRSSAKILFHAPLDLATVELESKIQVLDVGAGDGSWARDFLARNSNAIVYAVDLHGAFAIYRDEDPNYPEKPNCPENLNPEIDDCNGSGPLGWRLCRQARILLHSAIELILESSILKKI